MNKPKRIIGLLFLFILTISLVSANSLDFTETFTSSVVISRQGNVTSNADSSGAGVFTSTNYDDSLPLYELDNDWGCLKRHSASALCTISASDFLQLHTQSGACSSPSNCRNSFGTVLPELVNFVNSTVISFTCDNATDLSTDQLYLSFQQANGTDGFSLGLTTYVNICTTVGRPDNCYQYASSFSSCSSFGVHTVNISELKSTLSIPDSQLDNIKTIELRGVNGGTGAIQGQFQQLSVTGMQNGSNSLPTVSEFTMDNNIVCIDGDSDTVQVNYTLTATDEDNDTIYYAYDERLVDSFSIDVSEDFVTPDPQSGTCPPDYGFFTSGFYNSNYSIANNLFSQATALLSKFTNVHYIIADATCSGSLVTGNDIDKWVFNTKQAINDFAFTRLDLAFPDKDMKMSVGFLDSSYRELINVSFNQTELGNMSIVINGTIVYNNVSELFDYDSVTNIYVVKNNINMSANTHLINITFNGEVVFNQTYSIDTKDFSVFEFLTEDTRIAPQRGEWYLQFINLLAEGNRVTPSFSTVQPTINIGAPLGSRNITLFVSDEVNRPNTFKEVSAVVTLMRCQDYTSSQKIWGSADIKDAGNAFRTTDRFLCESFGALGDTFENERSASPFSTWFNLCTITHSIFTAFAIVIGGFVVFKGTWILGYITFLVMQGIFLWFFDYTRDFKVIYVGLWALLLANILVNWFMSRGGGERPQEDSGDRVEQ